MISKSDGGQAVCNPAQPLLFVIGIFCVVQGFAAVPAGFFVGPHILGAAAAMAAFGLAAIWLGRRPFDGVGRCATIIWSLLALVVIVAAAVWQPSSDWDGAGIVFVALLLLIFTTVLTAAIRKQSVRLPQ